MSAKGQYDMLGNLITTTTTPGPPTTTTTTTTIATLPPTTAMTNATTTTPQPTMFLADSAAPLNVFERYTHLESFLSRFTPIGLEVDLLTTAVYLPLSFLGLSLAAAVLFTWHTPHEAAKAYTVSSTAPPLWRHWRERRRGDALLRLLGFLCCPLLLIHCSFCLLLDLDGVWRLRLLSDVNGFRAFCPLVHSLDVTTRVTIALLVLLIAWRAHAISRTPHRRTISCYCRNPYRRWWCKLPCSLFSRVTAIVLMSFVVGLVGINFWQVTDITLQGAFESVELICSPVGGYQSGFQLLSSDANLMLYEWILNAVIFAPSTLGATAFALLLSRRLLANQGQVVLQTEAEVGERIAFAYSRRVVHRLQLAIAICVLYGLANLPLAAIRLLAVMATPGFAELPDRESLVDIGLRAVRTIERLGLRPRHWLAVRRVDAPHTAALTHAGRSIRPSALKFRSASIIGGWKIDGIQATQTEKLWVAGIGDSSLMGQMELVVSFLTIVAAFIMILRKIFSTGLITF
uniref:EGF region n=1 Tax=Echinococcus granulosus TaxID=6210 RepID=A0A068X059_ECHGR|nr:EGF region [Echinococcus granulosus]